MHFHRKSSSVLTWHLHTDTKPAPRCERSLRCDAAASQTLIRILGPGNVPQSRVMGEQSHVFFHRYYKIVMYLVSSAAA